MKLPYASSSGKKLILLDTPIKKNEIGVEAINRSASQVYALEIEKSLMKISPNYLKPTSSVHKEINKLWAHLQPSVGTSTQLWSVAKEVRLTFSTNHLNMNIPFFFCLMIVILIWFFSGLGPDMWFLLSHLFLEVY